MEVIKNAALSVSTLFGKITQSLKDEGGFKGWVKARKADVTKQYRLFVEAIKNFSEVNIKLGLFHLDHGNFYDARFRFRLVSLFNKDHPELNYFMGRAYFEDTKVNKAKGYIEKYLASGDTPYLTEAKYIYKLINQDAAIDSIPLPLTAHYFDLLEPIYDDVYLNSENPPQQFIFNIVNTFLNNQSKPFGNVTLDLGCGTGIMSYLSRSSKISSEITGVDISKRMLESSKALKIDNVAVFNSVENTDATSYLSNLPSDKKFHLIYAINLVNSIGNLDELFAKVYQTLDNTGIFAILFKTNKTEDKYTFDLNLEEFLHNNAYVQQLCQKLAFKVIEQAEIKQVDGSDSVYLILQK